MIHHVLRDAEAVSDSWTNWFFSMNLFNRFANRNKRFIYELQWNDCSCSRVENSLIQMIHLERVFFSELNSQVKNREISWARATDAVKSTCDEWGGAESRGNGARPVEWMIMNDTCATHRSRVPRRSFGRNKRRSDDIGRRERTRPGF